MQPAKIVFLVLTAIQSFAQQLKTIKPTIGAPNNYSKQDQALWKATLATYAKVSSGDLDYEKLNAKHKALIDSLEAGSGPMTDMGCSWYCGGQMYKVTSDTYLKAQGNIDYKPANVHDFDLLTAWVPDTAKGPIGKAISFHFKPLSPRVNEIIIYNGYVKNYDLFKANSRVKKFKLSINGVVQAMLDVADTTGRQSFTIDPIRSNNKQKDLVLTLEIVEIYKGEKYKDVAVSEINFSGLDVH